MNLTSNQLVLVGLALAVVVSLYLKGYIKLPSARPRLTYPPIGVGHSSVQAASLAPASDIESLAKLGTYALGIAFAKAHRIEADAEIAQKIAQDAGDQIKAAFTNPFSPPAPAGQDPNQAGVKP